MHDDLLDAVPTWSARAGPTRSRVAIYGGSYGGYAALVGAAFTPDVFCCAVDIVGPSNLKTLLETIPPYWAPMIAQLYRRVGNPETDEEFLWSRSPLSRARDIRIPLLIAQGANDPRVKQAESEQIVAALKTPGSTTSTCSSPTRARLRQAGEPAEVLRRGRALPGQVPRRPLRGVQSMGR
jgi:dipeptidyl aminopeptidase/acylaminoacyl peptidase